ncbi:hypothetical protein [Haloferula sargassicola]|uniref:CHASE2 domain-containing protein n=1 Tax=Haloferula sargassicola TaxID=490096 RepID=A0ABP9UT11_9BACT
MIRIEHPRFAGAVAALGVGLLLLAITTAVPPLEKADRAMFSWLTGGHPEVEGRGTLEDPRKIATYAAAPAPEPMAELTLEEDPEGWFESMPPPPSDIAVVLARLNEAGLEQMGIGYPLQWDEPDTLAIQAMRGVMDRFPGLVLGFPLKDSTAGDPVAAPFLRASIDDDEVAGDVTELPVVNAIRGVAPELGGRRTLAGFTRLESEKDESGRAYLLARWGDRVVFSLPLALEIARLGIGFGDVEIEVGNVIRLGPTGPRIPIDFRGRARLPEDEATAERVPLKAVIEKSLPEDFAQRPRPVVIGDGRLLGPKEDVAWTAQVPAVDALIRSAPVRASLREVPRLNGLLELALLIANALLCGWLFKAKLLELRAVIAVATTLVIAAIAAVSIRVWQVTPPLLAVVSQPLAAWLAVEYGRVSTRVGVVRSDQQPEPESKPDAKKSGGKKRRKKRRR